jgi:hypothetical protein
MSADQSGGDVFTTLSDAYVSDGRATHGTMMGFPCLRSDGVFFASLDPTTEALVVKLPAERVAVLIDSGAAEPFAPNGRRFREWAAVPSAAKTGWAELLAEAWSFASK